MTVGSNSNVGENGIDEELDRAAILEIDPRTRHERVFATGLRNPNGLGWEPETGALWTVVNERDELGSDLVPDYLTSVQRRRLLRLAVQLLRPARRHAREAAAPGSRREGDRAGLRARPAHRVARPRVLRARDGACRERYAGGTFVGQHGSWNRRPLSGYKVIFVPFATASHRPPEDVLTGFVDDDGDAHGRPVGVAIDRAGALLVADDVGNTVWRVQGPAAAPQSGAKRCRSRNRRRRSNRPEREQQPEQPAQEQPAPRAAGTGATGTRRQPAPDATGTGATGAAVNHRRRQSTRR